MKTAVAIRHVHFEDLGSFGPVLASRGYSVRYLQAGADDIAGLHSADIDLLVVLGGPIGAYEEAQYPFLTDELRLLETRLAAEQPTIGICLGAQLIARASGARVYPGLRKEIGWAPISITEAGMKSCVRFLVKTHVLHWHGDTFDLPKKATLLASTEICANQAFAVGNRIIGFQFHPEAMAARLEEWFIGHACEIANTRGVSASELRKDAKVYAPALLSNAQRCLIDWLENSGAQL
jgi:GMP synthase (glutamine-hydrolysing)